MVHLYSGRSLSSPEGIPCISSDKVKPISCSCSASPYQSVYMVTSDLVLVVSPALKTSSPRRRDFYCIFPYLSSMILH